MIFCLLCQCAIIILNFFLGNIKRHLNNQRTREETLDNIELPTKEKLMISKFSFKNAKKEEETLRIFATDSMLDNLKDANYAQFFLDGTFKCCPKGIKIKCLFD